jgi:hypothetical protein
MNKPADFGAAVRRHWMVWMGAFLFLVGLLPAVTRHTIPPWIFWLAGVICMFVACYQAWSEEYDKAAAYKQEADEMYSDAILDWLKQNHPMRFTAQYLADLLKWDVQKVDRGLKILEKEFSVVRNEATLGWTYDPRVGLLLDCGLRRLIPPAPPSPPA